MKPVLNSDQIWDMILNNPPFVIAEAGKNFIMTVGERSVEDYLRNAKLLVDEAVIAGAHAIKFQTHTIEDELLKISFDSPHFKGGDRFKWVTRNTLATPVEEFWKPLKQYCDQKGIIFFSTPMTRESAKKLAQVDVQLWKVGSADILDFVLLDYLRNTGKPILISSGMSTLDEVKRAVNFIKEKNDRVMLYHCVSRYPCPPESLRLGTINFLRQEFPGTPIGFSDHSIGQEGIMADLIATGLGVNSIEKHFSIGRDIYGADHKVSMTPDELEQLMKGIERMKNDPAYKAEIMSSEWAKKAQEVEVKELQPEEAVFPPIFRKSLMAARDIKAGEVVTKEMLYAMRPYIFAGGMPTSHEYVLVLGKTITKDLKKYDPITTACFS